MKLIIRVAILLGFAMLLAWASVHAAPFPWPSLKLADVDAVGFNTGQCRDGDTLRNIGAVTVVKGPLVRGTSDLWAYWYDADSGRAIVAYFPKGQAAPAEIGRAASRESATIFWEPYDAEKHGDSPCALLFPQPKTT